MNRAWYLIQIWAETKHHTYTHTPFFPHTHTHPFLLFISFSIDVKKQMKN
jgi:hypothetical protein